MNETLEYKHQLRTLLKKVLGRLESSEFMVADGDSRDWRSVARALGRAAIEPHHFHKRPSPVEDALFDVVDVFSGCGGTSGGFAGISQLAPFYRLAGAIEIDADANLSYLKNFGVKPLQRNVALLAQDRNGLKNLPAILGLRPGRPLVLIGCAPCQGFSAHRKKDNRVDSRNSLVTDFAVLAASLKPEVIVIENVPELLSGKHRPLFDTAERLLKKNGYVVKAQVVNMAEFGLPQKRMRALALAFRGPFEMPVGFLPPDQFVTVKETIGTLPMIKAGEICSADPMHVTARHRESTIAVIKRVPKDGGSRPKGVGPKCLDKVKGFSDVYGRLRWDQPAITITGYARNPASGRYVHPEQNRGLSIRETALLQGFPKWYEFLGTFDNRYSQIGNAVPPLFATHIAAHILGELARAEPESGRAPNEAKIEGSLTYASRIEPPVSSPSAVNSCDEIFNLGVPSQVTDPFLFLGKYKAKTCAFPRKQRSLSGSRPANVAKRCRFSPMSSGPGATAIPKLSRRFL